MAQTDPILRKKRTFLVGDQGPRKNSGSHIDASHSRQPLVKGERLVRYEVNAVMLTWHNYGLLTCKLLHASVSYEQLCDYIRIIPDAHLQSDW